MKKILALMLVLLMAAAIVPACADSLEVVPGTPANCPIDAFRTYFDLFTGNSGFTFTWDSDTVSEDGYDVYTARSEDGVLETKVYVSGGNVSHIIAEADGSFRTTDGEGAEQFGQWFGAVLAGGNMGLYVPEEGIEKVAEAAAGYENELMPLVEVLAGGFTSAADLENGVAGSVIALGYPTGLELNGSVSGTTVSLHMKIAITSKDGQVNVVK